MEVSSSERPGDPVRPRLVGVNHVALEVGDLEEALRFYGEIFELTDIECEDGIAFIGMGDQFLALNESDRAESDAVRHFGLVVEDKEATRAALSAAGVEILPGRFLDFLDPWGNRVQIVDYRDIQFTKPPQVLAAMGLTNLRKRQSALRELSVRGFLPEQP
jgi:catechol 2,3-dioxygenase-like lactoylglutathione lyase family enzyme